MKKSTAVEEEQDASRFDKSIEELHKYNERLRQESGKDTNVVADHELVKKAKFTYEVAQSLSTKLYKEGVYFYQKCTKPTKKDMRLLLGWHAAGFVLLAALGLLVRLVYTAVSAMLMLPKAGTF
eukprot:Protomagalhaensia_wolfi_Nauph_80__4428@NODE_4533_length_552_cov_693_013645_g3632_i0_p1_GENE_NODE_4533_length_552_cov_693_013645_g3632_i0NODE_4533_length_552_cov_693_013645_g3632_i0_p1_ORF_typecomplete_len124_score21_72SecE/PF00584_20/0_0002_NODE_4533_length_552_cov_693_013645_g3632_i0116487